MEETLSTLTEQGLAKALSYIEATEHFVIEQAPLLVQEVLAYGLVSNVMAALIYSVMGVAIGYGVYKGCKVANEDQCDEAAFMIGILGGGTVIGLAIALVQDAFVIAKIVFAPRLYLLETLSDLV